MPKVGDIVFAKTTDVYAEEAEVRPGIVTRVFTDSDGEWAKGREIVGITLFNRDGSTEALDMDKGVLDSEGVWEAGGWALTSDGPDAPVSVPATVVTPVVADASAPTDAPAPEGSQSA